MTDPANPKSRRPESDALGSSGQRQDTVLLSDVPDPSAFVTGTNVGQASPPPQLATASLAALGQRYDILGEAGHGSMGNVYKARDRETGETVALKLLKPEIASDQVMLDRFKNELLFARKITHKNVCRVHEFNRIGGIAFTSMEFVEGESLRSVLTRFGGLPPRKAISVAQQICSGLKEAHAQGIVHRDLKPENVMIDTQGNVKIMDFGIARSMESLTRLTGSMVGTPAYMAPEQVAGKAVDYRTDIYSLGLMLYEMFTGSRAFQADTAVAVALKQIRELPPPPHEVDPTVPVVLERAILKCLEKEPGKRFQSVAELVSVLRSQFSAAAVAGSAPAPRVVSSHTPTLTQVVPSPEKPAPRRALGLLWALLGAGTVLAALGGLHWAAIAKSAEQIPPPANLAVPKPPDFALSIPAPAPADVGGSDAKPASPAASKSAGGKRAVAKPQPPPVATALATGPNASASVKKAPGQGVKGEAPKAVQQRADKAFHQPDPDTPPNPTGSRYLWVGRYQNKDRAQDAVKKIEDLGLPVSIIPKRGAGGEAYVVFAGPFGAKRVPSVMEWLNSQGFKGVRVIPAPLANYNPKQ
jgi:serine/threonine protein kinase